MLTGSDETHGERTQGTRAGGAELRRAGRAHRWAERPQPAAQRRRSRRRRCGKTRDEQQRPGRRPPAPLGAGQDTGPEAAPALVPGRSLLRHARARPVGRHRHRGAGRLPRLATAADRPARRSEAPPQHRDPRQRRLAPGQSRRDRRTGGEHRRVAALSAARLRGDRGPALLQPFRRRPGGASPAPWPRTSPAAASRRADRP